MPLTPEDVHSKRFTTVRFKEGYDEEEVDAFLDEVEAELRRLLTENSELRTAPQPAAPQPAPVTPAAPPAEEPNEAALRTLLLAQRTADEAIAQAKQEADQIVTSAKTRAASIESEAQQQHAAAMAELQRQRQSLESQIEDLRGFEREYRTRLKAYLESQLRDLDSRGLQPGGAGSAGPGPGGAGGGGVPARTAPPSTPAPTPAPAPAGGAPAPAPAPGATPPPPAAAAPAPAGGVPRLAPPATPASPAAPVSPFSAAPPLVEDVDAGSDAPGGPPAEADGVDGEETKS